MGDKEFNDKLQEHFDDMNTVGLGELMLFGSDFERFCESDARYNRLLNAVKDVCGYHTSAREFAKMITREEFRKRYRIGEVSALGLKLYLLFCCGVDWDNPDKKVVGFGKIED